jgi:DnaJ like chaperone protein
VWGKIIGGMAGFAMGGPMGGVVGAALGHAAENGALGRLPGMSGFPGISGFATTARTAARLGNRDQAFAVAVVVLAAKLAKCDGPVVRAEIDAFKRNFRIPPEAARDVGRLFDRARDSSDRFEDYATQLGEMFPDKPDMLEDVLAGLFAIARADAPLNRAEENFLQTVCHRFGLDSNAWARAQDATTRRSRSSADAEDPYGVLGVSRGAGDEEIRLTWRKLMRENHPDSLASQGMPAEYIARAGDKVARINAAWDRIKRERGL